MGAEQDDKPSDGDSNANAGEKNRQPWWFNQPNPIDRFTGWLVAVTFLLTLATIVNAVVLWITDHTLKDQLAEVRKSSQQTERTVAAFEGLVAATNRSADNQAAASERLQKAYIEVTPLRELGGHLVAS